MITDEQLIAYQSEAGPADERARFEEELAGDADALRRLVDQERLDAALQMLHGPNANRARVKQSIMAVVSDVSRQQVKAGVMRDVAAHPARRSRRAEAHSESRSTQHASDAKGSPRLLTSAATRILIVRRSLLWGGVAGACVVLAFVLWPARPREGGVAVTPSPTPPADARRDQTLWPFAADSPWNTPIGAGAVFEEVLSAGVDVAKGAYVMDARRVHPLYIVHASDPEARIFVQDNSIPFAITRIPRAALLETQPRQTLHLIGEDGFTLFELTEATSPDGIDLRALTARRADLRGSGVPFQFNSANASGLSPLAGQIRRGELSAGIRHVLGVVVPMDAMSIRPDGSSHVWPAGWSPNNPAWTPRFRSAGNVYFGTLLAIPPSVDLASLGVGTNGPAYEIARALQDYGAYVKDVFTPEWFPEWQRAGWPHLVFCGEFDRNEAPQEFAAQLARVVRELKTVANNGPQSIGGGGTRRRPPAPEFAPPAR